MEEIQKLIARLPQLQDVSTEIEKATELLLETARKGGCIYTCGNGGSAADAEHIAGELMKSFVLERPLPKVEQDSLKNLGEDGIHLANVLQRGVKAIPLTGMPSLSTAYGNDCDPYCIFAQQVHSLGEKGDSIICISTSGNSKNVIYAAIAAKARGVNVISLLGKDGGQLKSLSTASIVVPEVETHLIQELHLPIYHAICLEVEKQLFAA